MTAGIVIVLRGSARLDRFAFCATAWILTFAIVLFTCAFNVPVTPRGVQCPTAAIQTIQVLSLKRSPCGCLVKVVEERAPREGEAGFKQCRCAERKAVERQEKATSTNSKPAVTLGFDQIALSYHGGGNLPEPLVCPAYRAETLSSPTFSPPTPPPQLA